MILIILKCLFMFCSHLKRKNQDISLQISPRKKKHFLAYKNNYSTLLIHFGLLAKSRPLYSQAVLVSSYIFLQQWLVDLQKISISSFCLWNNLYIHRKKRNNNEKNFVVVIALLCFNLKWESARRHAFLFYVLWPKYQDKCL